MVIKGKLITCKREVKEFKGKVSKEKLYVTLAEVKLSDEKMKEIQAAFQDAGKNFTPAWVKKFEGYVNLATEFELPCKDLEGNEHESVEEYIKESKFPYMGAEVKVSLNVKDGAVYPNSIIFLTEGKPYNPFAEFDNDDED
ncbi:MAG: hypothetical protein IIZ78_14995 [Clostridiales bacterium]|nr:hypothetical protein [Clostridiales bacterium]